MGGYDVVAWAVNCSACGNQAFLPVGDLCDACAPPQPKRERNPIVAGYGPRSNDEGRWLFLEWWAGRGR